MDHWSNVEELFHAALDRPLDERANFLRQACPDDDMRGEVQALLDNVRSDEFLEGSPLSNAQSAPTPLKRGDRIGAFEIIELIGRGGMGEVYKARDTRLDRIVALKRSHEQFSARFDREARAIGALNHPNICTLYDVGPDYLVIEFIEGVPLRHRIGGKALPAAEVLQIAQQVAEALVAAHAKGVIHRDIKPENILVNESGSGGVQVKVLDFGLARVVKESTLSPLTSAGSTMGTVAYMSPEQAKGEELDARTDLFSFGVVLYEMAAGRKPFEGSTNAVLFNAILNRDPEPPAIGEDLDRIILKLLEKDRNLRYQSAADLLADLRRVCRDSAGPIAAAIPQRRGRKVALWAVAAAAAVVIALAAAAMLLRRPANSPQLYRVAIETPRLDLTSTGSMALSHDGRRLAFISTDDSGARRLVVRSLESDGTQTVANADEPREFLFWSPDGRSIGYFTADSLEIVDLTNGQVRKLSRNDSFARGASWGNSGLILVSRMGDPERDWRAIHAIPASGGGSTQVTFPQGREMHTYPQFLPDGKRFLFCAGEGGKDFAELRLGTLGSHETRTLGTISGMAALAAPNLLLFRRGETLYAQRVNESTLAFTGDPIRVVDDIRYNSVNGYGNWTASDTGLLAFRRGGDFKRRLRWFDRSGKPLDDLTAPGSHWAFDVWGDGAKIAVSRYDPVAGTDQIWIGDPTRGPNVRLRGGGSESEEFPAWSPDGNRICYIVNRRKLMLIDLNNSGREQVLLEDAKILTLPVWTPDGRHVAVTEGPIDKRRILLVPVEPGKQSEIGPLIPSERFAHTMPQFSPDGKWIAYVSSETGMSEVYVRPFPNTGAGKWAVSSGRGVQPRWSADGREVFYVGTGSRLYAVPVSPGSGVFQAGKPVALFTMNMPLSNAVRYQYALSHDARRVLADVEAEGDDHNVELLIHWDALVK